MSEVNGPITRRHMWYGGASWDANDQIVALILRLAEVGILLATERAERRRGVRQHIEIALSSLKKRVFGLDETLATTLVGLATRIAAKIAAYTYGFYVNRVLGRPQGRIKELWA